jgi:hypothetical protein
MSAVYAAVEFIRRHPKAAELTRIHGVRGKIVRKFRFKIFYRVIAENDLIEIVHVRMDRGGHGRKIYPNEGQDGWPSILRRFRRRPMALNLDGLDHLLDHAA